MHTIRIAELGARIEVTLVIEPLLERYRAMVIRVHEVLMIICSNSESVCANRAERKRTIKYLNMPVSADEKDIAVDHYLGTLPINSQVRADTVNCCHLILEGHGSETLVHLPNKETKV